MMEDEVYRTSSQYRYWSYTQDSLSSLRRSTNDQASERVRAAIRRASGVPIEQNGHPNGETDRPEHDQAETGIETLTVEEELKIVRWGCQRIIDMAGVMEPPIPADIRATAIQYLRRFYLSNSPMTYHPKQIMMCALFLATKSDHWHIPLSVFVSKVGNNVTEEDVKAPEFLLMQGLRFTLEVRHPMRGLEGGVSEMLAMVDDRTFAVRGMDHKSMHKRVGAAAQRASGLLESAAQMTDAYFLYTPAQIWLAAMSVADKDLVEAYVDIKLEHVGPQGLALRENLLRTLAACADLLASYSSPEEDPAERKEMKRIGKKLHLCQNPEKVDLVAVTKAKAAEKREGGESGADKAKKKRKLERAKRESDGDVFGPELKSVPG